MARNAITGFVAFAFLLAGCAENAPEPTDDKDGEKSTVPTTNMFHLMRPPRTTLVAPNGTETISVPVDSGAAPFATANSIQWSYEFQNDTELEGGRAIFHVRVSEPTPHPAFPICTWTFDAWVNENNPGDDRQCSIVEDPAPLEGDYVVEFEFSPGEVEAEDRLFIQFQGFSTSDEARSTISILTGSAEFDSRVELEGMNETISAD